MTRGDTTGLPEEEMNRAQEQNVDGTVELEITRDKMEAYISITAPAGNGKRVTRDEVEALLNERGVVYGILSDSIDLAVNHYSTGLLIAKGRRPEDGRNGSIDFMVRASDIAGKPIELSDGRIDYYNLNLIQFVEPGDTLAIKVDATPGVPGSAVTGELISPKPGKEANIIPGRNVELSEDGCTAKAAERGHVIIEGNKIVVSPVYEVAGDVDFNTGNITFNGSVIVKGSICEGFKVVADGDVEVLQTISGGFVQCTGELRVKNGIVGRNKSEIKAGGNVVTRFVENAQVESGYDVVVSEAIMHSRVNAGHQIRVEGKGVIVGGIVRAGEEINCKIAGSSLATATELEAGTNPELRLQYNRLTKEKQAKEADSLKGKQALMYLKKIRDANGTLSKEQLEVLMRVNKSQTGLASELEELSTAIKQTEGLIEQSERGKITVQGLVHPGVKVSIGYASTTVRDDYKFVTFTRDGGEIRISPYK